MRDWHKVPCRNATFEQVKRQHHMTYADDRLCDRCRNSSRGTEGRPPQGPPLPLSPACSDLTVSSQHGTAPARGQVIFGDFLSVSRPGGQLQGFPSAGTGPSEGRAAHPHT